MVRADAGPAPSLWTVVTGLVLLVAIGWAAWNYGALAGLRWVEFDAPLTLAALGFVAGVGAFFAPCAFALFPGYISYYLTWTGAGRETPARSLGLGLTCAAGSTLFFALAGAAITPVGGAVSPYLIATKPVIALGVALLGVVLVADVRLPSVGVPLGATVRRLPPARASSSTASATRWPPPAARCRSTCPSSCCRSPAASRARPS